LDGGRKWEAEKILTSRAKMYLIDGIRIWFPDNIYKKGDKWSFIVQDCWFLLDKDGKRMTDQYSEFSKKNVFWMDWGNPDWQEY